MKASQGRRQGIGLRTAAWPIPALVDRMLVRYVDWSETTEAVDDSYGRWCAAPAREQATRFSAYLAALDQEQAAAAVYAESIGELERWLPNSDPGSSP